MTDLDNILEHRRKLDQKRRNVAMVEGALKQTLLRLKEEFGCKDIKRARKLYEQLQRDLAHKKDVAEKKQTAFEKKWQEHL